MRMFYGKLYNLKYKKWNFYFVFEFKVAPRLDKLNLKAVTVKAGQTVNLDASFLAEPEPTGTWSFEGTQITPDDRISFSFDAKGAKLVLLNSKRSDTGKYTIKLTNDSGSDSASVDVIVLCKSVSTFWL